MDKIEALSLLKAADVFYSNDDDDDDHQTLNQNDVWGWALVWAEYVPDEFLPEVAELFRWYGFPGLFYWVSERHDHMRSEFADINRHVDFVRHEETIKKQEPDSNRRAYLTVKYTLGEDPNGPLNQR